MNKLSLILTACVISAVSNVAMAKTEQITLKKDIGFGEEAVIFSTTQGEVIFNYFAFPDHVAKQIKPYKKGQCLEIQSKYGFFKDTGDGSYIQSIRPCNKKTQVSTTTKVNR
ncbi:hypothetical protein L313_1568 [Acinetobacter haemolyticus CIP 64.3 = MTCC 9819]|uniref:KTSC domain-containing protein n=1 Tax=Acinetobacter haemolyticus CIP 64.3 = MTCC 9819 TaxID=1217659 RepID=N9GD46_ACIHA|nr:hypothetical protein [Acinetobacter haemolyticus]ENW17425.1 hypothetical protein F927_02135 [Acinetobacter haemolyticus CIP 64.3 = MTCC 9819]EPR89236.1 hypothetical protein L313_1568 [Acinetobacter haemolyticus CIP 64.3 = MTCC 9819]NAR90708.1 hypothetical protein [Acinetobacter haemolyticus]NAS00619.1 hypothetical protein [Acinetobacter haemolyticus]NAS03914.1 hypothetical protein [Acinetobacter haemolyticus]